MVRRSPKRGHQLWAFLLLLGIVVQLISFAPRSYARQVPNQPPRGLRTIGSATQLASSTKNELGLKDKLANLPLAFEELSPTRFVTRGANFTALLSSTCFEVSSRSGPTRDRLKVKLVDANPVAEAYEADKLPGTNNYFFGRDSDRWRTDVATYRRVTFRSVYDSIDLVHYGSQQQFEYDFIVRPGGNPGDIELRFSGVRKLRLNKNGDLSLFTARDEIRQLKPTIYQEVNGQREPVEGAYVLKSKNTIGFELGTFDPARPLVIDPILVYSTYLGGSNDDFVHAVAVDDFGNVYLAGETLSLDFPSSGGFQPQLKSTTDGFITKINAAGTAILYSSYLGGSGHDRIYATAVDPQGNIYLTGETSSTDFPVQNPFQSNLVSQGFGGQDAFITKLSTSGSSLGFSTYFGGAHLDVGHGIAIDAGGNIYIAGIGGPALLTTSQAFQPNTTGHVEAFISKFNPSGTTLLYSSFLGGTFNDAALGVAVDAAQNAYLVGYTESGTDFPITNAFQPNFGGGLSDAFFARLATATSPAPFANDSFDTENGGVAATNYSSFTNWNVTNGSADLSANFVTGTGLAINLDGHPPQGVTIETKNQLVFQPKSYRLRFSLSIRGSTSKVTVRLGTAYTEVFTANNQELSLGPITRDIQINAPTNAKLSFEHIDGIGSGVFVDDVTLFEKNSGEFVSYLGGINDENRLIVALNSGIKLDNNGNILLSGWTRSPNFPVANAIQNSLAGGIDAFVSKFNASGTTLLYSTYLGGTGDDHANEIAVDSSGNAYIAGNTTSTNFPVRNAIQSVFGGETVFYGDAFVTKLNATGSQMVYSTYLGSSGRDLAESIAVDREGNAIVGGYSTSIGFPMSHAIQAQLRGGWEGFVSKIPSVIGTGTPSVFGVSPARLGNSGISGLQLRGENLTGLMATVKLVRPGSNDVLAISATVTGPASISVAFDLSGVEGGLWDVVVQFSDGTSKTLAQALTVVAGGQPNVWTEVIGPRTVRMGQKQKYHVIVGNSGDSDAFQVPVFIRAPKRVEPKINEIIEAPVTPTGRNTDWNSIENFFEDGDDLVTPLYVSRVPANSSTSIEVEVNPKTLESFQVETWLNRPAVRQLTNTVQDKALFEECVTDVVQFAFRTAVGMLLKHDCADFAVYVGSELARGSIESVAENRPRFLSARKLISGGILFLKCAIHLIPQAQALAITKIVLKNIGRLDDGIEVADLAVTCLMAFSKVVPLNPSNISVVGSFDPNLKIGPEGGGPSRYIQSTKPLNYAIYFENKSTATAPAQTVTITDQLDSDLDLKTFAFDSIGFGNKKIKVSKVSNSFSVDVDLRPAKNLITRVTGALNTDSRQVVWQFFSLDPATGLPTTDPLAGFLPPNVNSPEGDGVVLFSVSPKSSLPTGTKIENQAAILFDNNPVIDTPLWSNSLDDTKPTSHVHALPQLHSSASFNVQWSGVDTGSGVRSYTIYVSEDGGAYVPWLTSTAANQAVFTSSGNHSYSFFSVAQDGAGNLELPKSSAEASTSVQGVLRITGQVRNPEGNPFANVTLKVSGSRSFTLKSDNNGNYSISSLPQGNYTITPIKTNYSFTPVSKNFPVLDSDQSASFDSSQSFSAPILVSDSFSTRAIAIDSVTWVTYPFAINPPVPWNTNQTRVMLFTMNLELLPSESSSVLTVDAEDGSHQMHNLTVEYAWLVPGFDWLGCVIVRLPESLSDAGDVLVRLRARGHSSNRVRLAIGHGGDGPPDDQGAVPTPGRFP